MGFDWGVTISVEYNQPLKWTDLLKLLNSFLTFRNDAGALGPRALAARESGQVARRTRASVGKKRGAEDIKEDKDEEDEDEDGLAPDPEKDIPEGERREFFYREIAKRDDPYREHRSLVYEKDGRWWYNGDADFDLENNWPERMEEAFGLVMKELAGDEWGEKIVLTIEKGGAYGEADEGAEERSLRLAYKVCFPSSFLLFFAPRCVADPRWMLTSIVHAQPLIVYPGGMLDVGRGGANAPWGVKMSAIPRLGAEEEAAVIKHFQLVLKTFKQLECEPDCPPSLRLMTVADGG